MQIEGVKYARDSIWMPLAVPDSFVVRDNKIEAGHGEAKFYVGSRNDPNLRRFFGDEGFSITALFIREDLIQFLEDTKIEYLRPTQSYNNSSRLSRLWAERMQLVTEHKSEYIAFKCNEQIAGGVRCYIKGVINSSYELLRELPLPNRATILIEKYCSGVGDERFVFRLRCSALPPDQRDILEQHLAIEIRQDTSLSETTRDQLVLSRVGQGKYRDLLFKSCGAQCPFTGIKDERLLTASHIKPWAHSDNAERLNSQNGFVFSPTYDRLFDQGLITFSDDGHVVSSGSLTPIMIGDLEIPDTPEFKLPLFGSENVGRRRFLEYHRRNIFLP